ncbi:MAG: hemerythrin domain-containing protein [Methanomassiliicoccales archaeon]|nr:hemerythrin domain-containing protein [Methanomassiliicoccales archaeon]
MRISITILQYDHGIIRQVLDIVGEVLRTHRASKHMSDLREAVVFLEQFMDRFHHAKEENFLFPVAVKECPKIADTFERLIDEHATARHMMKRIIKAIDEGDEETTMREGLALVDHVTIHINEEENQVFPVIENDLQLETDALVHAQYEKFMTNEFGKSYYKVSEEFANDLQDRILGPGHFQGIA